MKPVYARAGDTFFTHSSTLLGRVIRWGETDPGETNGTWANHAGVVVEDGWIGEDGAAVDVGPGRTLRIGRDVPAAIVIEALWKTRRGPLDLSKGLEVRVFRPIPEYTEEERNRFVIAAAKYVGDTYGWWKLLVQLADRQIFKGRKVLTTALYRDDRPICSYLAAKVNEAARPIGTVVRYPGERLASWPGFGMPPQAADPDEMMDFCLAFPGAWLEVL